MRGSPSADPALIAAWLAARSIARRLPAPVADHGGWRVDTQSENEECRYVFATSGPSVARLAATIERPRVFLKVAAEPDVLARLIPSGWQVEGDTWVMTCAAIPAEPVIPAGYSVSVERVAETVYARLLASDGSEAASGFAAEAGGVFVYDRIGTAPAHRRRGVGRALMAVLGSTRRSSASRQVLVATRDGRALYTRLGWEVHAPYATAFIPEVSV